jgi:hypothetical protein
LLKSAELVVHVKLHEIELHRGAEPALSQMAGQFEPGMDARAVSAMGCGEGRPQTVKKAGCR